MSKNILTLKRIFVGFLVGILTFSFFGVRSSASASTVQQAGTIRYVATSGTDSGNCSSPASACRTLQYAVNQAASGNTILIAQGTYTYNPAADTACSFLVQNEKSVVCIVDKVLSIFGGFSTSNWTTPNPSANLTVIDGQNNYRGVFLLGYATTNTSLNMEGFTIQNGRSAGSQAGADLNGFGGGMVVSGARVTLRDMVFRNNKIYGLQGSVGGAGAGAGLAINWSQPGTSNLLERVTFEGNQSFGATGTDRGGLAYGALFVNGSVAINSGTFTNNQALAASSSGSGTGGGLAADALGGAIGGGGGAWILQNIVATNNQAIGGNATTNAGGGFGGAIFVEEATSFAISNSYISGNIARGGNAAEGGFGAGGGILVNNTPATIESVQLVANSAIGGNALTGSGKAGAAGGGGLYLWKNKNMSANASVTNTIITDNYVSIGSVGSTNQSGGGGGIQAQGLTATISHTTIAQNRLGPTLASGQGLLVIEAPGVSSTTVTVNHSIIANHTDGGAGASAVYVYPGNTLNFNRGLFAGNTRNTTGSINGLSSMLSASSAGFVSPGSPNYNYHLQSNSAARDQATGSTAALDIDGEGRPQNGISDLGADEVWPVCQGDERDTAGVFRPSNGLLYLKNCNTTGFADVAINYGIGGDYPVVGDWDGDGDATIGIYRNGSFYLRNSNTIGFADLVFTFGLPGDQPVAGDWDGDGDDTIGVYRSSTGQFFLRNSNNAGPAQMSFFLGNVGDVGIAGDWDGDGKDTTGVFRPSNGFIFLKNSNSTGFADIALNYGLPGDKPVMGDWNDDGIDTIGVYRGNTFYLRNSNTVGFAEIIFSLGNSGDIPIAGDWDASP